MCLWLHVGTDKPGTNSYQIADHMAIHHPVNCVFKPELQILFCFYVSHYGLFRKQSEILSDYLNIEKWWQRVQCQWSQEINQSVKAASNLFKEFNSSKFIDFHYVQYTSMRWRIWMISFWGSGVWSQKSI